MKEKAFTLIEILVVVAILVLHFRAVRMKTVRIL